MSAVDSSNRRKESDFRSAWTVEVVHHELADVLWERVKAFVTAEITIGSEADDSRWELELEGTWMADGINPNLLFVRYTGDDHFGPHTDGCTIVDANRRSVCPVIVYLSACSKGGGDTLMIDDLQKEKQILKDDKGRYSAAPELVIAAVEPKPGRVLSFYYSEMHAGSPVVDGGTKYIIRTDIMYNRKFPILTGVDDGKAFSMWLEAQRLAEVGEMEAAMQMFRKCFKLSEELRLLLRM
eukprot:GHVS01027904.1.p1 GENE.GHVS01027904.1~~GHVS01027904.1.p1  ORF type:complete len:239 (+),score=35.10 GHVS01027904.1:102-818(+)